MLLTAYVTGRDASAHGNRGRQLNCNEIFNSVM